MYSVMSMAYYLYSIFMSQNLISEEMGILGGVQSFGIPALATFYYYYFFGYLSFVAIVAIRLINCLKIII